MALDIGTLLMSSILVTACCVAARMLLWRLHPTIPGLGYWVWAGICGVLGLVLIVLRQTWPEWLALSLAQMLILIGVLLTWEGVRLFLGRTLLDRDLVIGAFLLAATALGVAYVGDSILVRSVSNAALVGTVSALICRELLLGCPPQLTARRFTGWVYGANALFFLLRLISLLRPLSLDGKMVFDGVTAASVLWWLAFVIMVTLGMVLMTGERLREDLHRQAGRDPLTGALNRRAFLPLAEAELARARRSGTPVSLIMVDMDHFKQLNDRLGHGVGDEALVLFAELVRRTLRTEDLLCRFGGEEFLVLLPGGATADALGAAERLREAYAREASGLDPQGRLGFRPTLSAGACTWQDGEGLDAMIRRADLALYRAKDAGRGRCEAAD